MHSSRMRTARSSSRISRGGSASVHPGIPTPLTAGTPRSRPPSSRHPPSGSRPPMSRHPLGADTPLPPWEQTPQEQTHPPGSRQPSRSTPPRSRLPCGQTHACKNITFATSLRTVISIFILSDVFVIKFV